MATNFEKIALAAVGQYNTNTSTIQYIPESTVGFTVNGLKPKTRVSIFFDGINVTSLCAPASYKSTIKTPKRNDYHTAGSQGDPLITDSNGTLIGIFYIPAKTYQVGTRELHVFNYTSPTDTYAAKVANHTCEAYAYFRAFNHSNVDSENSSVISTIPSGSTSSVTLTNRGSGTSTTTDSNKPRFDPLCQTFYVGSDLTNGDDGFYLGAIDLYFASKASSQPISIDIRTVENNLPTATILPHSRVTLKASQVTSDSTGATPTRFKFETPVYLRSGYSYAFGITPGGQVPGYSLFTGVVGKKDATNGIVNSNWGQGILYTSSTGSTWTAVNNEYIKFIMYREDHPETGTAIFVNDDYEFLTFSKSSTKKFRVGEYVYQMPQPLPGFVSCNTTSNVISYNVSASGSLSCNLAQVFAVNDHILVVGSTPASNGSLRNGAFSNVFTAAVTSVTSTQVQFRYANGATAVAPWAIANATFYKPASGTVNISNTSLTVTGTGTSLSTQFNDDNPLIAVWSNGTFDGHEVLWPDVISSPTSMTVLNKPFTTNSTAIPFSAPAGKIVGIDYNRNMLIIDRSTANGSSSNTAWKNLYSTTSYFSPSRVIVGSQSKATALISRPVDIVINSMQPTEYKISVQSTSIGYSVDATDTTYGAVTIPTLSTSSTNYFTDEVIVASKTNEINKNNGEKSFILTAELNTKSQKLTPAVEIDNFSLLAKTNLIGPTASREHTNEGSALAKSISKVVTLGDGNDAEDIQVYLTAYKPVGTDIKVYAKILNASDTQNFNKKMWTPLEQITDSNLFSDTTNQQDYKEFQYSIPVDPITSISPDLVTVSSNATNTILTSTVGDTEWTGIYDSGDLITIYSDNSTNPSSYEVHSISSVDSDTQITLSDEISFGNTSGAVIGTMAYPYAGFKNSLNQNIVRYYTSDGAPHDTFKQFAIKIVMLSSNTALTPKIADMRTLALSV